MWVGVVISLGFALSHIPVVKRHEDQVMAGLMILPVLLLVIGLAGGLLVVWKKRKCRF